MEFLVLQLTLYTMAMLFVPNVCTNYHDTKRLRFPSFLDKYKDLTLEEIILQIESLVCQSGNRISVYCSKCYSDVDCNKYRDCCPNLQLNQLRKNVKQDPDVYRCISTAPSLTEYDDGYLSVTALSFCPTNDGMKSESPLKRLRKKCDTANAIVSRDVWEMLPVSSLETGIVYRNIYCAQCNNDSYKISKWQLSISCESMLSDLISLAGTREDTILQLSTNCFEEIKIPKDLNVRDCSWRHPSLIDSCNVTGKWRYYNKIIDKACALYESIIFYKYRNIFCYLCNTDESILNLDQGEIKNAHQPSQYSALFTFDDYPVLPSTLSRQATRCPHNAIYVGATDECHQQLCTEGKYLTSSGECRSLMSSNMLGYQVCLVFDVSTNQTLDVSQAQGLTMWKPNYTFPSILEHVLALDNWWPNNTIISVHWQAKIFRQGLLEDLEQDVEKAIINYKQFIEDFLGTNLAHFSYRFLNACPNFVKQTCLEDSKTLGPKGGCVYFINYTVVTNCSFLELPRRQFLDKLDKSVEFTPTKKEISSRNIYIVNKTIVRLCVSAYINLTTADLNITHKWNNKTLEILHDISITGGLISVICTVISLTCLLLTFITYLLLPTLRSTSGKNLMVLIVTLFLAQTFYEFTLEQTEDKAACIVFGVLIHYTWLTALFSMNACTIERFYMLCFPLTSRAFFLSKRPFILATAYTLLAPLAVCVVNMVANYGTRGQLGYGGDYVCFITSKVSRIASFAVPVAIIVLVNISLMTFTVCKLRRGSSTQVESSLQSKLGLVAMVRLSVVTGLMWLLAFLYDVSNNKYVDYAITALIGLHGVVLFLSLVNKRVAQLLINVCRTRQNRNQWRN